MKTDENTGKIFCPDILCQREEVSANVNLRGSLLQASPASAAPETEGSPPVQVLVGT